MNTTEVVEKMLLEGKHINKFDLLAVTSSVCLPQRILDIRQKGWNISSKSIKGKGTLKEYWLEPAEIARIKGNKIEVVEPRKDEDEQLHFATENVAPNDRNEVCEQLGIGLLGGRNY